MKIKLITASLSAWFEFKDTINLTYINWAKAVANNFLIINRTQVNRLKRGHLKKLCNMGFQFKFNLFNI